MKPIAQLSGTLPGIGVALCRVCSDHPAFLRMQGLPVRSGWDF